MFTFCVHGPLCNFASVKATQWVSHGLCFFFSFFVALANTWGQAPPRFVLKVGTVVGGDQQHKHMSHSLPFRSCVYCVSSRSTVAKSLWFDFLSCHLVEFSFWIRAKKESAGHFVQSKGDLTCTSLCCSQVELWGKLHLDEVHLKWLLSILT